MGSRPFTFWEWVIPETETRPAHLPLPDPGVRGGVWAGVVFGEWTAASALRPVSDVAGRNEALSERPAATGVSPPVCATGALGRSQMAHGATRLFWNVAV